MSWKRKIWKLVSVMLWCLLGGGMTVLLVAAVKKKDRDVCKGIAVSIAGAESYSFLDRQGIMEILGFTTENNPQGETAVSVDLRKLEQRLEKNIWVKSAELYFDNNRLLHVKVKEREPVARIFTRRGSSFYIDSSGRKLPLSDRMNLRLPVFTGFVPEGTAKLNKRDQALLKDIKTLSMFILNDEFWMAQVAQINIVPGNRFELAPTIGNHIIDFGNARNYESKFEKLRVFYKQVLGKTGFDKYSRLDLRYERQVVATKRGSMPGIDSLQVIRNVQKMIADAHRPVTEGNPER